MSDHMPLFFIACIAHCDEFVVVDEFKSNLIMKYSIQMVSINFVHMNVIWIFSGAYNLNFVKICVYNIFTAEHKLIFNMECALYRLRN